jgi:thioredoxin reductase (NADPH)
VVAAGSTLARLGAPGEVELAGRGVSYCAVCDGPFFRDQPVAVVGGGDSAFDEALVLAEVASAVTVLVRGPEPRAARTLVERAAAHPAVTVCTESVVEAIEGSEGVERLLVRGPDGGVTALPCAGVFIYTGLEPNTGLLRDSLPLDPAGHIPVDAWMRTAVPGVFAAGDIRQHSARQLASAAGDGATAAVAVARYLRTGEWPGMTPIS